MSAPTLSPYQPNTDSLVTIGRILKPFGIRGEVKVESLSDVPGRFERLETIFLTLPHDGAIPEETNVTLVREISSGYLLKCSAFSTPEEAARQAAENDVHILGISSLAAGHKTLVPELVGHLKDQGGEDIMVVVGGIIPPKDYQFLYDCGVHAIYGPGSNIPDAASDVLKLIPGKNR